jgi:hypothetical protein
VLLTALLSGVGGALLATLVGGTGKYWALRRDAWTLARTSGLLLLADVRELLAAKPTDDVVATTRLGVASWEAHRETLAAFRRGSFPNGYQAKEWLDLAVHFARLERLGARPEANDTAWWLEAKNSLTAAEELLRRFQDDPRIVGYVLAGSFRR